MLKIADNKIADADELKTRMIDEWAQFDQSIVDAAISQWRRRLSIFVSVYPGHKSINCVKFEKRLFYKLIILLNKPHFSLLYAN